MRPLRVVHIVCTDAFAGVERYVLDSALNLTAAGCVVVVVGGSESSMRAPLERAGVEWYSGSTVSTALRSLRSIARPDALITHMTKADLAGVLAARRFRAPVVSIRHFASRRGSSAAFRLLARWMSGRIAAQIAISEYVAANVDGAATVVHTGVADTTAPIAEREPFVLVAQRLEAEKFTDVALRAWALVTDREPWMLKVAGDGARRAELEALSQSLGIADTVEFLGFRADVGTLMDRASIFFAPTPREGLGIAVLEAMAHETPVVAARAGGHLESVGSVPDAAMFEPGDDSEAAAQLERLVADSRERRNYGRSLRERQRDAFNIRDQTARTLEILQSVVTTK